MHGHRQCAVPAENPQDIVLAALAVPADFARCGAVIECQRADRHVLGRMESRFEQ